MTGRDPSMVDECDCLKEYICILNLVDLSYMFAMIHGVLIIYIISLSLIFGRLMILYKFTLKKTEQYKVYEFYN